MINIVVRNSFIKDLKLIKGSIQYNRIKQFIFIELPKIDRLENLSNIKKLKGYKNYYRFRIGEYRIGLTLNKNTLILERVLHRKDIYKYFPS